jgi:ketosteroid isomerase-like protein
MKTSITISIRGIFMILVTLTMIACQTKGPVVSTSVDEAAIRKVLDENLTRVHALNKDNAESYVKFLYAEDANLFPPNKTLIKGHQAITEYYQTYPPMTDFNMGTEEIMIFSDLAYLWNTWSVTLPLPNQGTYKDSGTIISIWHKQNDGSWKLWREIWHSDIPVPESASTRP